MKGSHASHLTPVLFLAPPRWYSAHCAARSLGRLGVPVFMLRHQGMSPSNLSRYCAGTFPGGDNGRPQGNPLAIVSDLLVAGQELGQGTILIPGTDEWAVFIAQHDLDLRQVFHFPHPSPALVAGLASKRGLYELACRHDFPSPRLVTPANLKEALALAESLVYPVMVKPDVSRPDVEMKGVAHNPGELAEHARALAESADAPNLIFQEYIPGHDDWTFTAYFDAESRCVAGFTGQRLRTLPPHMGHTSLGLCRSNPELARLASQFISEIGFQGVVDSEFRYDPRDGKYKLLDANPRVGGNFRVFLDVGGIDVIRALYLDLLGKPVPPVKPREGRLWLKEDSDLISFVRQRREGELDLATWLRSLKKVEEGATFSLRDPLPFLTAMLMLVTDTVEGRVRRRS